MIFKVWALWQWVYSTTLFQLHFTGPEMNNTYLTQHSKGN